jgi:EAL and modified HD-GYP domain-containing signal transduction protein
MITSLVRAKLCETIGQKVLSAEVAANGFLTGMLSLLDAILDQPMSEILQQLDLSSDIQSALLRQESPLCKLLDVSLALEEGDWRWIAALAFQMQIEEEVIQKHYEQAVLWASEITSEMD